MIEKMMKMIEKYRVVMIFCISTVYIILYKLCFLNYSEIFSGAFELGEILYAISIALMTSTIFYYFIVYLKEKSSKRKVEAVINNRLSRLELRSSLIYHAICSKSTYESIPEDWPEHDVFRDICSKIKLRDSPPPYLNGYMIQFNNWFEYFQYTFALDKSDIDLLFNYSQFINEETLAKFNDVMQTFFHTGISQYQYSAEPYSNDLSNLDSVLLNYLNMLKSFKQNSWK
jgi:hypothetical protein